MRRANWTRLDFLSSFLLVLDAKIFFRLIFIWKFGIMLVSDACFGRLRYGKKHELFVNLRRISNKKYVVHVAFEVKLRKNNKFIKKIA